MASTFWLLFLLSRAESGGKVKSFSGRGLLENSCSLCFEVALQSLVKCLAHNGHSTKITLNTLNSMDSYLMKDFAAVLRYLARIMSAPEKNKQISNTKQQL